MTTNTRAPIVLALLTLLPLVAHADADPADTAATVGYELALAGATRGEREHALTLTGVGYEVEGLADLRGRAGLVVDAEITARTGTGSATTRTTVSRASTRTEAGGRFTLRIDLPSQALSAPRVELTLHRANQAGRRFHYSIATMRDEAIDLLTDRQRYQPGETVHAWVRVRGSRAEVPHAGRRVKVTLTDSGGNPLAEHEGETGASGVLLADLTLADAAEAGSYRVLAEVLGPERGPTAARSIQVWQRTVERVLARVEIDQADEDGVALVRPGGALDGRVVVRTPSGTPVRGAQVALRVRGGAEPTELTTDGAGVARFSLNAPAFLSGDVGSEQLTARVVHTAYGTITASARYLIARVPAVVSLTPRGGALVPEVDSTIYVHVSDPRGRPLAAGTEAVVRGAGLPDAGQTVTIDDRGIGEVTVRLPRGGAATMRGGPCAGRVAASFEVEVRTTPPRFTTSCVGVSAEADVALEVNGAPVVRPGAGVELAIRRRPRAAGRPVLVEAIYGGRAVAFAWVDGRASRGEIAIPDDLLGVVTLRARALADANAREDGDEPGATAFGVGAMDAVLVRPPDAFSITVAPERERYLVREQASVSITASQDDATGWAALLVRDEAAHGGEGPWDLFWMRGALHEAVQQPADEVSARFVRSSLAGQLGLDPEPPRPPPLESPYWRNPRHRRPYHEGMQAGRGILRDPTALREELLRRGLGIYETRLEQAVSALGTDPAERAPIVSGRGFHPQVIEHLVSLHRLSESSARTLGGEPITVGMIEAADPGFSFDIVARRVARARLSKLLLALLHLTDADNPHAQRASANLPPERWLGTLVQLNMVQARDLVDPWGRPYQFRRVTGRRPTIAISERALDWELASPGPDGRINTGDDVRDPFARAVPEGTPYAVVSGEEQLMRQLAALAPTSTVLSRMGQAYQRLSLAAQEEQTSGVVTASNSEVSDEEVAFEQSVRRRARRAEGATSADAPLAGLDGLGGGGGQGYGRGGPMQAAAPAPPPGEPEPTAEAEMMDEADDDAGGRREREQQQTRAQTLGTLIREDFPATLYFAGEVDLASGRAEVEVPLADALTTYLLEAIVWTPGGWTTSGDGRVSVDQRALVDAPVPPYATVGDRIRLPVRVENRTDAALPVRVVVDAEGELAIDAVDPIVLEIPPERAQEAIVEIALSRAGEGQIVVSLESEGEGIDAVRRPIQVMADARTARDRRVVLVDERVELPIEIPERASERGPGQIRLVVDGHLFGDPTELDASLWGAWALAVAGEPLPEAMTERALAMVGYEDEGRDRLRPPMDSALALSAVWRSDAVTDDDAARALRSIGQNLPPRERMRDVPPESFGEQPAWLLLAMAPMAGDLDRRPALREDATALLDRLAQMAAAQATSANEAPTTWARAAAALALTGRQRPRAEELVRRAARHLVRVGDMAWVEPESYSGREPRARPTALMALAQAGLGRRGHALSLVRALIDMQLTHSAPPPPWVIRGDIVPPPFFSGMERALASAAAARLTPGAAPGEARILVDGAPVETSLEGDVIVAELAGLGRPGAHVVAVELPEGSVAVAHFALAYLVPWDVAPRRRALIDVTIDGETGARDTRAGLALRVQNRGARLLTEPVVEIELPAGSELDEPTREQLASLLRADAHMEGRTLILPLRPLAPGGWVRLPIPARWALSGTLRGLGVVAYDAQGPDRADILPVAVLASRAVELADEGPEPEPPDPEASEPEPTIPPPIPLLDRLSTGGL